MPRALRLADPRLWVLVLLGVGLMARAAGAEPWSEERVRGYRLEVETCAPGRPCRPMPSRSAPGGRYPCLARAEALRERLSFVRLPRGLTLAIRCATVPGLPRA